MKQTLKTTVVALGLGLASVFLAAGPMSAKAGAGAAAPTPIAKPVALGSKARDRVVTLSNRDREAIAFTVSTHVWALSNGLPGIVHAQVTPKLQETFHDPRTLMIFLAKTHPQVALASDYHLDGLTFVGTTPVQHLYVVDHKKRQWFVSYGMMRDEAGRWRIESGRVLPAPGTLI